MVLDRGISERLRAFFQACSDECNYIPTFGECQKTHKDPEKKKYYFRLVKLFPKLDHITAEEKKSLFHSFNQKRKFFKKGIDKKKQYGISSWEKIRKIPDKTEINKSIAGSLSGSEANLDNRGTIVFDLGRIVPEFAGIKQTIKIKQPTGDVAKKQLVEALQLKVHAVNNEQLDTEFEYQKLKRDKMKAEVESMKVNKKAEDLYDELLGTVQNFMKSLDASPVKSEALASVTKNEADTLLKVSQILKKK